MRREGAGVKREQTMVESAFAHEGFATGLRGVKVTVSRGVQGGAWTGGTWVGGVGWGCQGTKGRT